MPATRPSPPRRSPPAHDELTGADEHAERPQIADARAGQSLRIGDVARLVGTTPRTIRYYEEIGLLAEAPREASRAATACTPRPRSSACAR